VPSASVVKLFLSFNNYVALPTFYHSGFFLGAGGGLVLFIGGAGSFGLFDLSPLPFQSTARLINTTVIATPIPATSIMPPL
jgi:hypothetical protein